MKIAPIDKETTYNFNEKDDDAIIYTRSKPVVKYLKSMGYTPTKVITDEGLFLSADFIIPKNRIRVLKPLPKKI